MSRIEPLSIDELRADQRDALIRAADLMGFVANDALIMARNPDLLKAFAALVATVYAPGKVDDGLKRLIGLVTSAAAGCQYCMGHTAFTSQHHGVDAEKLAAIWEFEQSGLFSDAEKAALRVALLAGQSPGGVMDEDFKELAGHFDRNEQLEIVAVIAMFGFLNRWNSTLATDLESKPQAALEATRTDTN
jgi:uncharacterized peroxidase-related enzyme